MKRNKYETPEIVVNRFDVNTRTMVDVIDGDVVREVLNNPDESRMFGVSAKQMHEKNEDYVENQPDLNSLTFISFFPVESNTLSISTV